MTGSAAGEKDVAPWRPKLKWMTSYVPEKLSQFPGTVALVHCSPLTVLEAWPPEPHPPLWNALIECCCSIARALAPYLQCAAAVRGSSARQQAQRAKRAQLLSTPARARGIWRLFPYPKQFGARSKRADAAACVRARVRCVCAQLYAH